MCCGGIRWCVVLGFYLVFCLGFWGLVVWFGCSCRLVWLLWGFGGFGWVICLGVLIWGVGVFLGFVVCVFVVVMGIGVIGGFILMGLLISFRNCVFIILVMLMVDSGLGFE